MFLIPPYKFVNTLQTLLLHLFEISIYFMQHTYKQIIEQTSFVQRVVTPNDKELLMHLFGEVHREKIYSYTHHIVVYIHTDEQPIPFIVLSGSENISEFKIEMTMFKARLLSLPKIDFNSLLFIVSVFSVRPNLQSVLFKKNRSPVIIDTWLKETNGYVFYSHQLEQLYCMLTGANYMEAIGFRKDWNLKRKSAIHLAQKTKVNDTFTLADALQQNTVDPNQFVFNANYSGAYSLWNYLQHQSKEDSHLPQ